MLSSLLSAFLWLSSLLTFVFGGGLYALLSAVVPPRRTHRLAQLACRLILLAAGQRVRLLKAFPAVEEGPYIYVFNHTSLLDTFVMITVIPEFTGAIGKKEQFDVPLWGWILRRWGAVPIDRKDAKDAIQRMDKVEEAVHSGLSLLIAPEGTRSPDGALLPFKKGPFHIALNTKTPIVPVAIKGAYRAKNKNSWKLTPSTITVDLALNVVPSEDGSTVESLAQETRQRIQNKIGAQEVGPA